MKDSKWNARVFVAENFPKSISYAKNIIKVGCVPAPFSVEIVDVNKEPEKWKPLKLKSVPAIVLYHDGIACDNIVRYAAHEDILARCEENLSAAVEKESYPVDYFILDSSGAHRYERWNECFLVHLTPVNGWAAPNRSTKIKDYIVLRCAKEALIDEIFLLPRVRSDGTPSYKSFPRVITVEVRSDNENFVFAGRFEIDSLRPQEWVPIKIDQGWVRDIRLTIDEKRNINGKSFPCIASIKLLAKETRGASLAYVKRNIIRNLADGQYKTGLLATDGCLVEAFSLPPSDMLASHWAPTKRLIVVTRGAINLHFNSEKVLATEGESVLVEGGQSVAAQGGTTGGHFVIIRNNNTEDSIWEAR